MSGVYCVRRGDRLAVVEDGAAAEGRLRPMRDLRLLVLVGLTGAGKSTVEGALAGDRGYHRLPDRRRLTDEVMIPWAQVEAGEPATEVGDRAERFRLTAAYRCAHPGGMAQLLESMQVEAPGATGSSETLLFDGLRGRNEVEWAVERLPRARFLMLDASTMSRLERLVSRRDGFDRSQPAPPVEGLGLDRRLATVAGDLLTARQQDTVLSWIASGAVDDEACLQRLAILAAEARSYDSPATREALADAVGAGRALILDTDQLSAAEVANQTLEWLSRWPA